MKLALTLASATALSLALAAPAQAEVFDFDKSHTQILFEYDHLGYSITQGSFGEWEGTLVVDADDPTASSLEVTIQTASIDTGFEGRDDHFRSADFFDVEAFPVATFVSTQVEQTGEDSLAVTGDLTILGTTQPVTLDVVVNTLSPHPMTNQLTLGFTATTQISRTDFGLGLYAPAIGDEVSIRISG
ncbi:MAG: YceI family protein, partial [Alphaproteobacteria bacterium]